jgi:shikimate dehydrogenase
MPEPIKWGLLGYPLGHSFSKPYFIEKFRRKGLSHHHYILLELPQIELLPEALSAEPELKGFNVTIPYKEKVMAYLDDLDPLAEAIGAVNVVKKIGSTWKGFNSDYHGFRVSLEHMLAGKNPKKALVLGSGGASKAVNKALHDMGISATTVGREPSPGKLSYEDLHRRTELLREHRLIVNCTPLGTSPATDTCPDIPFNHLSSEHFLFDLVYNPAETLFMKKGKEIGAQVKNGWEMLVLQAEKAWEIWNSPL